MRLLIEWQPAPPTAVEPREPVELPRATPPHRAELAVLHAFLTWQCFAARKTGMGARRIKQSKQFRVADLTLCGWARRLLMLAPSAPLRQKLCRQQGRRRLPGPLERRQTAPWTRRVRR